MYDFNKLDLAICELQANSRVENCDLPIEKHINIDKYSSEIIYYV